ncbi:phosphotransferase enzyme family protein [Diplodia corticola]|uniref:Phosphotransferase enzyme family protein n=1 Tax=Diplodia corticola TaxID=236234 RepID=A0A1J9QU68_9PEZI|nr:phosphotransferase enzyme family protein [Diplodia corticola]OJD31992.1 phosphotransferase enzyme family protein [Diplodia corticola]
MSLTTTSQLEVYLASVGIDFTSVEQLPGGTGNFVWRLTLPSGEARIVKHAEPYVKANPSIPFSVDRMQFEASALSLLPQTLTSTQLDPTAPSPTVRLPTLHHSDPDAHILIMSDAGPHNLKAWYPTAAASTTTIPRVGAALGAWLAQLHRRTRSLARRSFDNAAARGIGRHAYANLAAAFARHHGLDLDPAYARAVDDEFGARLQAEAEAADGVCVCHGDFWPGNVLVRTGEEEDGPAAVVLSVVDWEMTRRGTGTTDVAQFAAEAYLLDRFCGGKGLLEAFLEGYVRAAREDGGVGGAAGKEAFVQRLVVHFGVHLAVWPSVVTWCGKEETGELARFGKRCIEAGWDLNWAAVREGPLAPVLSLLE